MVTSGNMDFARWLSSELEERGWNQADLCRASRLSPALVSRIVTGTRNPGPSACKGIARALGYSTETVYRAAGLLKSSGERDKRREYLEGVAEQLDDQEYTDLLGYIEYKLSRRKAK